MSNNESRTATTFFIWLALTVIMVAAFVTQPNVTGFTGFIGFMALLAAATISTLAIWTRKDGEMVADQDTQKAKRRTKVERLLERLDDTDLDELRTRLTADSDGEQVSLHDLLAEREHNQPR